MAAVMYLARPGLDWPMPGQFGPTAGVGGGVGWAALAGGHVSCTMQLGSMPGGSC